MMDNPRTRGYYGGITSGPVFKAIAERIVNSSSKISRTVVAQRDPSRDRVLSVPDMRSMQPEFARRMLSSMGLKGRTYGKGSIIVRQTPEAGRPAADQGCHQARVRRVLAGSPRLTGRSIGTGKRGRTVQAYRSPEKPNRSAATHTNRRMSGV